MDVIPAIDLLNGACVRLYQGDYAQSQVYGDRPVEVALQWAEQGATMLHIVDLDGAKVGKVVNHQAIAQIVQSVPVKVQVGGGLRDFASVEQLLSLGVHRVILGTIAVEQPKLVADLCQAFPQQIVVGIDARNGKVATRGWLETSEVLATDLAQQMQKLGAATIIYTDIQGLAKQLESALKQVQDLAVKAIEGAANINSYQAVKEIAIEQAKTQVKNK